MNTECFLKLKNDLKTLRIDSPIPELLNTAEHRRF